MVLQRNNVFDSLPEGEVYVAYLGHDMTQWLARQIPHCDLISIAFAVEGREPAAVVKTVLGPVYWYRIPQFDLPIRAKV